MQLEERNFKLDKWKIQHTQSAGCGLYMYASGSHVVSLDASVVVLGRGGTFNGGIQNSVIWPPDAALSERTDAVPMGIL